MTTKQIKETRDLIVFSTLNEALNELRNLKLSLTEPDLASFLVEISIYTLKNYGMREEDTRALLCAIINVAMKEWKRY